MNKKNILIGTIISIIITFWFAELFSIYHFGDKPTLLTFFYLISIFGIFEDIILSFIYIIKKVINKEKIKVKMIVGGLLLFIALLLIFSYGISLNIDWLNWYANSSPFYINVIIKTLLYILPAIILILVGVKIMRKK